MRSSFFIIIQKQLERVILYARRLLTVRLKLTRRKLFFFCLSIFCILFVFLNIFFMFFFALHYKTEVLSTIPGKLFYPVYKDARRIIKFTLNLSYVFKMYGGGPIPEYYLSIDPADLKKLDDNLPDILDPAVLNGEKRAWLTGPFAVAVPAHFIYKDVDYDVEVRYRGDNASHWTRAKRSWQVTFKKKNPFFGTRTIKLIIPQDRKYFGEELNNYRARKLGLFPPDSQFVKLHINGVSYGVYFQIEDWTSSYLEKKQLPSNSNFYSPSDEMLYGEPSGSVIWGAVEYWNKKVRDTVTTFDNYGELDYLISLFNDVKAGKSGTYEKLKRIVDLDNFYKWNIITVMSGTDHQVGPNTRLFFNNSSGQFQFVPWDASFETKSGVVNAFSGTVASILLEDPHIALEQKKVLWNYVNDTDARADDLAYYDTLYAQFKAHFYADWKKADNNFTFDATAQRIRNSVINRPKQLSSLLQNNESNASVWFDARKRMMRLTIRVTNYSGLLLREIDISTDVNQTAQLYYDTNSNNLYDRDDALLARSTYNTEKGLLHFTMDNDVLLHAAFRFVDKPVEHNLFVVFQKEDRQLALDGVVLRAVNAVTGHPIEWYRMRYADVSTFDQIEESIATVPAFIAAHPGFIRRGQDIRLPAGDYYFDKTIIVPSNTTVWIDPGVSMRLAPSVSFVSYSPIIARGTEESPIRFMPARSGQPWGTVAIVQAGDATSTFSHAFIQGGSGDYVNGAFITGMLAVHRSNLVLDHSEIRDARADDGVNVKYGTVAIENSLFAGNSADGFDLDYGHGIVKNNRFMRNGSDGVEISGSSVFIYGNQILYSADSCVNVGEQSNNLVIANNVLERCAVGVTSKDLSAPVIIHNTIINNGVGLNSYQEKEIFGGASPRVYNSIVWNNEISVQDDTLSKTSIEFSTVEGGFPGTGNNQRKPDNSTTSVADIGDPAITLQWLGIDRVKVPMGLLENIPY